MTRIAAVHLWRENFLVHPRSRTTDGVWIFVTPVESLALGCSDTELSDAVRRALAGSRAGIEHPVDWRPVGRELLKAAGSPSQRSFYAGKVTVDLEAEEDELLVMVTFENRGPKHGFVEKERIPLPESAKTGDELGARIREALDDE